MCVLHVCEYAHLPTRYWCLVWPLYVWLDCWSISVVVRLVAWLPIGQCPGCRVTVCSAYLVTSSLPASLRHLSAPPIRLAMSRSPSGSREERETDDMRPPSPGSDPRRSRERRWTDGGSDGDENACCTPPRTTTPERGSMEDSCAAEEAKEALLVAPHV